MESKSRHISSLKIICLILAILPVGALVSIIVYLIIKSMPAITNVGWELFSTHFSSGIRSGTSVKLYGLLPALWGTFLVVFLAMLIATPVSLSMAIMSSDFSLGFLSPAVRWILGVLSGIPPIIYAVMGATFFSLFIIPKFLGLGLPPESRPPPGMLPSDNSCTLLGGIMLALLIIPFMSPLLVDAIKNVPHSLKEASFSLGANRWHTLTRVTIPSALSGITNALTLGVLIAMGDAIIVAYVIGLEVKDLPSPLFDVLERIAPLTSLAAGLAGGGLTKEDLSSPVQKSVASFIGLLLLVMAFAILGLAMYFQRRLKKRLLA